MTEPSPGDTPPASENTPEVTTPGDAVGQMGASGAGTPPDVPAQNMPPEQPTDPVRATGRAGKTRNVVLVWLVWPIITLGIYHIVWWYKINREARDFAGINVEPALSALAITLGVFIIVPPYVSIYRTGDRIAIMQRAAGMQESCNPWLGLILSFFFGLHALYYQIELNKIWERLGYPEEGTLVAMPPGAPASVAPGVRAA